MTPTQEAIQYWNDRMVEAGTAQLRQAAALFVQYLESLLPKEKEFAEKCWDGGEDFGVWLKSDGTHYPKQVQTKQHFLNQLYPEK